MTTTNFKDLFARATGYSPYPWQTRLAMGEELPDIIDVETGLGKTAAVIVGWLYNRRYAADNVRKETPRRLIICLPTRVLVEQTFDTGRTILTNLGLEATGDDGVLLKILWGGDVDNDIDRFPERDMIIIGTQDLLLSRALNRGYAMSKFRWPSHFAILNNDSLWIMDEVQLMGVGATTSAQLKAFRSRLGTVGPHKTIWMSATMDRGAISTVDHPASAENLSILKLGDDDLAAPKVSSIVQAKKTVRVSPIKPEKDDKKSNLPLAARINEVHERGTITLVILNTVSRAMATFRDLKKAEMDTPIVLLHSHFRPGDRSAHYDQVRNGGDLIVVSTQVIEAGADISAKNLITDLAPWPSMVQRFGRCNRRGEYSDATIEWIDPGDVIDEKWALPYSVEELSASRELMIPLDDGSPASLSKVQYAPVKKRTPVIRRKDMLELFDTTPDLMGNDLDISRFVRSSENTDVYAYWRSFEDAPTADVSGPSQAELCSVPISSMKDYLAENKAWTWDYIDGEWVQLSNAEVRSLRPGSILLLDRRNGGYSDTMGWTGSKEDIPSIIESSETIGTDSQKKDTYLGNRWVTLADHTAHVVSEAMELSELCPAEFRNAVIEAAKWHDVGKSHEAFQNVFQREYAPHEGIWGKGVRNQGSQYYTIGKDGEKQARPFFRHELASALAHMAYVGRGVHKDLTTYLVAAHHGKVRTSIRSIPSERGPSRDALFARGIWDGDVIHYPEVFDNEIQLDLSPLRMGSASWTSMALGLRDDPDLGPFRLSFLETVLRVADWRASGKEDRDEQ